MSRNIEAIYPLSPMQEGMLFHSLYDTVSRLYVEQLSWVARGRFDHDAFERAWQHVADRHGILRSVFIWEQQKKPLQVVRQQSPVTWERHDWRLIPVAEHGARRAAYLEADRCRGFDLARTPPLRLSLLQLTDDTSMVVLTFHHILLDGWSLALVLKEVTAAYLAFAGGEEPRLAACRPYRDYIKWLQQQDDKAAEAFWRDALRGLEGPTPLPGDRRTGPAEAEGPSASFNQHVVKLSPEVTAGLSAMGRRHQLTVNTIVQGAWGLLLGRRSGLRDVVFGATVSGRPSALAGVDSMVGLFINTLPLRARLEDDETVVAWLERLQAQQVEMRQYEYSALVDVRRWSGVHASQQLFESIVVFENYPTEPQDPSVASSHTVEQFRFSETTNYPLTLTAAPGPQLLLRVNYDGRRFDVADIERMLAQFSAGLASMARTPTQKLGEIAFLTPAERDRVAGWNAASSRSYDLDVCVHRLFEAQAQRTPDAPAVRCDDRTLTYAQLNDRANAIAARLRQSGVGTESRVGLYLGRSPELLVAILGVLKAGGTYVPLDPTYPRDRIAFMVADAGTSAIVTERALQQELPPHESAVICVDGEEPAGALDNPDHRVTAANVAYMIYTSGSTGRPKGVQVPHGALVNFLASMRERPGLTGSDRLLAVTTLSFDIAGLELFLPLTTGAEVILAGRDVAADGPRLAALAAASRATVMQATPATWRLLLDAGWSPSPSMKMLCGGEALPRDLAARLVQNGATLWNLYGPTETTIWSTAQDVTIAGGAESIGRPIANTQIHVLDPLLRATAVGFAGELFIGGAGVARGYWNRPDLTAERFVPDPFSRVPGARMYRTGDGARYLPDGRIEYLGRLDHQVKVRGFRIELGEIEVVLAECAGVRQAVALVREDVPGDPRIVAYIENDQAPPAVNALRTHIASRLPRYMHPSFYVMLDALPLTPNGKVDRAALPAPDGARQSTDAYVPPQSEMQERIARVWAEILRVDRVGLTDNFFDLGGHSLLLMRVHGRLVEEGLAGDLSLMDLFQYPSVEALSRRLAGDPEEAPWERRVRTRAGQSFSRDAIAIVGIAGRYPGAPDIETFWANLRDGVEGIRFFTDEELRAEGVDERLLRDERFVRARGALDGVDQFDAGFFGYTPREAELIDPQQRVFLECAWEALEAAGYDADRFDGPIGVYAGSAVNTYSANVFSRPDLMAAAGGTQLLISSSTEYMPSRVSYKLNLRGPSVNVQAACSTSLVAIHHACRSLLEGDCDLALAGGVSVFVPMNAGYIYTEGGIHSPDGHCRSFDADARGTVPGCGVGVVVLKRLADAVAGGDHIHAVIRGTAVNNDGSSKVGYTAPSVEGQAEVIALAYAAAGVSPSTIGFVESHGTGTLLGDPIEVTALTKVFGPGSRQGTCALGAVKTNIGHLDAAAGIAGLTKAVLALEKRSIPPTLHYREPNPEISFEKTPFHINTTAIDWEAGETPRRAGVNSFGIGGTNIHAVLEEAPETAPSGPSRPAQAFVLSAKSAVALDRAADRLVSHLRRHPDEPAADIAYTLQVGRRAFTHRRSVVGSTVEEIVAALEGQDPKRVVAGVAPAAPPPFAFAFTGQGSQYVGMGAGLYEHEPAFREQVDECCELLKPLIGRDLRGLLYPAPDQSAEAALLLQRTEFAQPALFVTEYALARLWMSWGVRPDAMIGHSLGEYVAAAIAGVFSLQDALGLVAVRAGLMQAQPTGSMLAVSLDESAVAARLPADLSIAAVNSVDVTVVSGPHEAIETFAAALAADRIPTQPLRTSHAFHSAMMEPVLGPFAAALRRIRLRAPRIAYISNLTGTWIKASEAVDPQYWLRHLRQGVRFAAGIDELLKDGSRVVLEVGAGDGLAGLIRRHASRPGKSRVLSSLGRDAHEIDDYSFLMRTVTQLWVAGARIDWDAIHARERRRRLQLPTYPFERQSYWIKPGARAGAAAATVMSKRPDVKDWFYLPSWKRSLTPASAAEAPPRHILLFEDETALGASLTRRLRETGNQVTTVVAADRYARLDADTYTLDPRSGAGYESLLDDLARTGPLPTRIVHMWSIGPAASTGFDRAQQLGFYSLMHLARALARQTAATEIFVAGNYLQDVDADDPVVPAKRTVLGACTVLAQELAAVRCSCIDLAIDDQSTDRLRELMITALVAEIGAGVSDPVIAYRGPHRWVQTFEPAPLPASPRAGALRDDGVYLITGGLGSIGLRVAAHLARECRAKLCLVTRSAAKVLEEFDGVKAGRAHAGNASGVVRQLLDMESLGAEVAIFPADVADSAAMRRIIDATIARFGRLDGVVHAAGILGGAAFRTLESLSVEDVESHFRAKARGVEALRDALAGRRLDFVLLTSSIATVLGGLGYGAYAAANHYLDAFAHCRNREDGPRWIALNWDGWNFGDHGDARSALLDLAMTADEGVETFQRVLSQPHATRIVVSTADLALRIERYVTQTPPHSTSQEESTRYARPSIASAFVAPADQVEQAVADIWQDLLGIDQVGAQDDFFELGGHSLLATRVIARVKEQFQINLPLRVMFEAPTVSGIAERVKQSLWIAKGRDTLLAVGAANREEIEL
jgi:polyketide synthase PksJ